MNHKFNEEYLEVTNRKKEELCHKCLGTSFEMKANVDGQMDVVYTMVGDEKVISRCWCQSRAI